QRFTFAVAVVLVGSGAGPGVSICRYAVSEGFVAVGSPIAVVNTRFVLSMARSDVLDWSTPLSCQIVNSQVVGVPGLQFCVSTLWRSLDVRTNTYRRSSDGLRRFKPPVLFGGDIWLSCHDIH